MPVFSSPGYEAPFFDAAGKLLGFGNPNAGLYANALIASSVSFVSSQRFPVTGSLEEIQAVVANLNQDPNTGKPRPTVRLLEVVRALSSEQREELSKQIDRVAKDNGIQLTFTEDPSTPMLYWGDACAYAITSDGYILMKLRGTQSHPGLIEPTGIGFRSVSSGRARTAQEDAAKETEEESNLVGNVRIIGVNTRSNTLQAKVLTDDKGQHFVGLMPAMSRIAVLELPYTLAEALDGKLKLNSEAFGVLPISLEAFDKIAKGQPIAIPCHLSEAAEAQETFTRLNAWAKGTQLPMDRLRAAMSGQNKLIISPNKQAKYPVSQSPVFLWGINQSHGRAVGRDHLAEAAWVAMTIGRALSPAAMPYARKKANVDPITSIDPGFALQIGGKSGARRQDRQP
jgi:hypothetical protein